jgi:hypothetical protein
MSGAPNWTKANSVTISRNASLVTLEGSPPWKESGILTIEDNPVLTSLHGLHRLKTVYGIHIERNPALASLDGLDSIHINKDGLYLLENPVLRDISALDRISIASHHDSYVDIRHNPMLSECALHSICEFFINSNNQIIDNNAVGCNSAAEVELQCLTSTKELPFASMTLFPNPASDAISSAIGTAGATFSLYNQMGMAVSHGSWTGTLDVSRLPEGLYTLLLQTGDLVHRGRFIKY